MLGNLSFCLSFVVLGIWLMKYDSIKRRFVKSNICETVTILLFQKIALLLGCTIPVTELPIA